MSDTREPTSPAVGKEADSPKRRRFTARHALVLAIALVVLLWVLWQRCGVSGCPTVERLTAYQPGGASVLLDASGEQFADLSPIEHEIVPFDSLPEYIPEAFVAVEDKRFYDHHGVDFRRVIGALLANVKSRGISQGFSTITMQLARNVWPERLPGQQRTLRRKILEVRVAREIERKYEKKAILELYLNHIYFGDGAYGIEAAAQNYFRKHAQELTLGEAALLAAMPRSPSMYNPRRFRNRALQRRDLVLSLMVKQRFITTDEADGAKQKDIRVRRDPPPMKNESTVAPYFVEAVRRVLENHFGEDLYASPLRIHTTLDQKAQAAAEEQLRRQLASIERGAYGRYGGARYQAGATYEEDPEYLQGAVVVLSADSGAVRALVGGRDYAQSRFNRATRARRQAGSAFKPFVYAAALEDGYPPSQLISDSTLRLELPGGVVWEPKNATGEYEGYVSLREALVRSKNVPTIRLARETGLDEVKRVARRAGIRSEIPETPSMAIGSASVTPLEMTAAYSVFANLGQAVDPQFVTRVENGRGKTVWQPKVKRHKVLDPDAAYLVTDMLREAVSRGTGAAVRRAGYTGVAAGKTGTTNDGSDVWFVGYTPDYIASVWIGFDRPGEITKDASGGRLAAPVWGRLMRTLYAKRKAAVAWERPDHVVEHAIDPSTGFVLVEGCEPRRGKAGTELFIKGTEPPAQCPRGRPAPGEATVFDRFDEWLQRLWHEGTSWLASHVGTGQRPPPRGQQRYLGAPRLPRAIETPEVNLDSIVPIPVDTSVFVPPMFEDTMQPDSATLDTIVLPDSAVADTTALSGGSR